MKLKSICALFILLNWNLTSKCQKIDSVLSKSFVPVDLKTGNKILLIKIDEYQSGKVKEYQRFFSKNYVGAFEIVPVNISLDNAYPDLKIYKYVLVLKGALSKEDFNGISNKDIFFDKTDSTFNRTGSSLFIFDRSSNHHLYESRVQTITKAGYSGNEVYHGWEDKAMANRSHEGETNFKGLKPYIQILNGE